MSESVMLTDADLAATADKLRVLAAAQATIEMDIPDLLALVAEVRASREANRQAAETDRPTIDEVLYSAMYSELRERLGHRASVLLTDLRNAYVSRESVVTG